MNAKRNLMDSNILILTLYQNNYKSSYYYKKPKYFIEWSIIARVFKIESNLINLHKFNMRKTYHEFVDCILLKILKFTIDRLDI